MPTALVTLGRLPKALTLTRALNDAGYRVVVAEPFNWHLLRVSNSVARCHRVPAPNQNPEGYLEALLEIVRLEKVDVVIPVSEETFHVLALATRLPDHVTLVGPPLDSYRRLADKLSFASLVSTQGLRMPDTFSAADPAAAALLAEHDCILKPMRGCSGVGVEKLAAGSPLPSAQEDHLLQRFIPGDTFSSLTLVDGGNSRHTVVYRGRVFSGTVAICFEEVHDQPNIIRWLEQFIPTLPFHGFVAFDFIVDESGQAWPIECNPRLTSGAHFFPPATLASALATPGATGIEAPGSSSSADVPRRAQWAYSTLTEAYAHLFRGRGRAFLATLRDMFTSRDVVWSSRDPLPFLLMTPLSLPLLWPALTEGISLGEACQRDIAPLWSDGEQDLSYSMATANAEAGNGS